MPECSFECSVYTSLADKQICRLLLFKKTFQCVCISLLVDSVFLDSETF